MSALEGIRVLDLSRMPPPAYCVMILADHGAEVIKIEAPFEPNAPSIDSGYSPHPQQEDAKEQAAYNPFNRNKKSIVLNLKSEEARQVFYRLVEKADVIVEGFRPGVAERMGIGYKTVSKANPGIVYCSLTGYGQDGPYRDLPGHDINYISTAGALGLNGESNGPPVIPYASLATCAGSLSAALGILLALRAREKSGKGQYVDIASTDGVVSLMTSASIDYFRKGIVPRRGESYRNGKYPFYNTYRTKDGEYISLGCPETHFWEKLCHAIGREDFIPHQYVEGEKKEEIVSYLKDYFGSRTQEESFDKLTKDNLPISKVHSIDGVFSDPQVLHRQMVIDVEHPELGKVRQTGIAIKLSDTPGKVKSTAPLLGEHTEEILLDLGYTKEQIFALREVGALG